MAQSLNLTATIRDFNAAGTTGAVPGHPDFETFGTGLVTGLVQSQLGANGKPVFGPNGATGITSATSFSQWYNTTPGINLATTITLTANETSPGIYTYTNNSYFPIDGQLLGNQGQSHNFDFTTEIDTTFTYQANQTFSVTGNHDIWVFINNKLAIDLGGVHGPATGNLTLDATTAAFLSLTPGGVYNFNIFQANRHQIISEFNFSTSIKLQQSKK
jgi:fibro-slime domain-containing protein